MDLHNIAPGKSATEGRKESSQQPLRNELLNDTLLRPPADGRAELEALVARL